MIKKHIKKPIIIIILIFILIQAPFFHQLISYTVMFTYNKYEEKDSLIKTENINFKIPGGLKTLKKDWYPFVMTYNAGEGFSNYSGKDVDLTILYNFGAYYNLKPSTSYYNPESQYFSSFYGGYLIKNKDEKQQPYGINQKAQFNIEEIMAVPKYDQQYLVLDSLGCKVKDSIMEFDITSIEKNKSYIGYNNWVKINAEIITNSPIHKYDEFKRAYLQYGYPIEEYVEKTPFPIVTLKGRMYVRYFQQYKTTICLYIIAPNEEAIEECDKKFLSKSILN